jgi:hypothetical protein
MQEPVSEEFSPTPKPPEAPAAPVDTATLYDRWRMDPKPEHLSAVVSSLDRSIGYRLGSMGIADNPQMRHQARLITADAVRKYDPASGVALSTWTQNNLQALQRFRRENQGPVKLPDRAVLDGWALARAANELEDELGYEPDVQTLADRTGLSVKRIASVRKATRPVAAASQMSFDPTTSESDFLGEALEYVYDESDVIDRKIIEHTTGYGGAEMMSKFDLAKKLGVSPAQITRRAERLGHKIQEMERQAQEVHA